MNTDNWRWQMQNAVVKLDDLLQHANLNEYQKNWLKDNFSYQDLPFYITPYFVSLIKPMNDCPIFKQVVSSDLENKQEKFLLKDPLGEEVRQKVPYLVHRYQDRVLFLATDRCASYCRFCTRKRWVGQGPTPHKEDAQEAFLYIKEHTEINEIIFSGGDPLVLSNERLDYLLQNAFSIPHINFVRIHSRILSFLPMRIDDGLLKIFSKYKPLYLVTHFNHYDEITDHTMQSIDKLLQAGVVLLNQSVLLQGINDSAETLKKLFIKLTKHRIKPYYLHQCDLINGSAHFRVPLKKSLEIYSQLRGSISGICIPQFMIETPHGGGKIAINHNFITKEDDNFIYLKGYDDKLEAYPKI